MSAELASALLSALDEDALAELAGKLAPYLPQPVTVDEDRWMNSRDAAAYLGLTPNALKKLTAARRVPFEQDVAGGKCWFLKSELDVWRRAGGRRLTAVRA